MDNKTLHDVLVCLELQREMIMKLFEFCDYAKEDRKPNAVGERRDWQAGALSERKHKAADYIHEHNKQIEERIKTLKVQIMAKE